MLLEVKRKLFNRTDRVKNVDFHPTEPWLLTGLYNGTVQIYHVDTGAVLKTFEVSEVPVRCARFVARKQWFVAGSDDYQLRVFNYNTHEKVHAFEAHPDYIRCLTVHLTASVILTGSDDMTIRAWDWDKNWKCVQVFEGHTHYIMNIAINPKDPNTFASSCLDRTVKMWSLGSSTANFTMDAHDKGVNCVDFYPGPDRPYLVTASDDKTIKVWDYLSKSCVQTLQSHTNNVLFVAFHPRLPVIVSGGEDGTVKLWNSGTYRLENTLGYALERAWCMAFRPDGNDIAFGYDEGVVSIALGRDEPAYSMDPAGKLIYTRTHDVLSANLATLDASALPADGARITLPAKEVGSTEVFATSLIHSPNGRFVAAVGDGEYIVYTALAWRNKAFGAGGAFAWAADSNTYAVAEGRSKVRVWRAFKERTSPALKGVGGFNVEGLYGGPLLAARSPGFVVFWDWETGDIVRRIDVEAKNVIWSGSGELVAIIADDSFYVLRFDRAAYDAKVETGADLGDEGVEEAFDIIAEIAEGIKTAKWIGDCFIYTTNTNRLNYLVGSASETVASFDTPLYLLGYMPQHNRIYLVDKSIAVVSYTLSLAVVEYQTAILRGDLPAAEALLPGIPREQRNRVARFLEARGLKELAFEVTQDDAHKFELALGLDDLDGAHALALKLAPSDPANPEAVSVSPDTWRTLGDAALSVWRVELARDAYSRAGDLSALLLLLLSTGDRAGLADVATRAAKAGQNNLAFAALLQLGVEGREMATELLLGTGREPEAAMFARTYAPSLAPKAVDTWKTTLVSSGKKKIASGIAHPVENADLFTEGWEEALEREAAHAPKANGGAPLIDLDGNDGEEDEGEEESEEE